jgi:hypothetical protein
MVIDGVANAWKKNPESMTQDRFRMVMTVVKRRSSKARASVD